MHKLSKVMYEQHKAKLIEAGGVKDQDWVLAWSLPGFSARVVKIIFWDYKSNFEVIRVIDPDKWVEPSRRLYKKVLRAMYLRRKS